MLTSLILLFLVHAIYPDWRVAWAVALITYALQPYPPPGERFELKLRKPWHRGPPP